MTVNHIVHRFVEMFTVQGGGGFNHYKVRARMAIMEKNFKLAESIYLEQVCVQQLAIMYMYNIIMIILILISGCLINIYSLLLVICTCIVNYCLFDCLVILQTLKLKSFLRNSLHLHLGFMVI